MTWNPRPKPIPYTRRWYTAKQLAEGFSVDVGVIYWLAKSGKLPSKKFSPGRRRFPLSSVSAMLKAGFNLKIQ